MKRNILTIVFLAILLTVSAQPHRPRVAVVLSGGGAKGVAHIGALKVIEEAGLPVDIVCGTSMGSLVGGLYALGYSTSALDSLVRAQDWTHLLTDRVDPSLLTIDELARERAYALEHELSFGPWQAPGGGVIAGLNLAQLFNHLCQGYTDSISFDSLPIRFACVATNIVDNTEIDFHSGHLTQAMRASMAIPGVFTPVRIGNMVLVDGGLRNNYPVDIAREMGADIVIGVSVQGDPATADDLSGAVNIMNQIIDVNCKNKYDRNLAMSDVVARVNVEGYSAASFYDEAIDTLLRRGEEAMRSHWDELVALRRKYGIDSASATHPSRSIAPMQPDPSLAIRRRPMARVGFRFDTEELGALQLGVVAPLPTDQPADLHLTLRLGQRIMAKAELNSYFNIAYTYRRNVLDLYHLGKRTYNIRYRQHTIELLPLDVTLHRSLLRLGFRWDYFDYYGSVLSSNIRLLNISDANSFSGHIEMARNTENRRDNPTQGYRASVVVAYRTPELLAFKPADGLLDAKLYWQSNIAASARLTFRPLFCSRLLFADHVPEAYTNAIGGEWAGHYVEQQLPFAGINNLEYIGPYFASVGLNVDYRLGKNHHVVLRSSYGVHTSDLAAVGQYSHIYGVQFGYTYSTILGPIDLRLGYSNATKHVGFFANFGYDF